MVYVVNRGIQRDIFSGRASEVQRGAGSGFIWDASGHVVTNYHVVKDADEVIVHGGLHPDNGAVRSSTGDGNHGDGHARVHVQELACGMEDGFSRHRAQPWFQSQSIAKGKPRINSFMPLDPEDDEQEDSNYPDQDLVVNEIGINHEADPD